MREMGGRGKLGKQGPVTLASLGKGRLKTGTPTPGHLHNPERAEVPWSHRRGVLTEPAEPAEPPLERRDVGPGLSCSVTSF